MGDLLSLKGRWESDGRLSKHGQFGLDRISWFQIDAMRAAVKFTNVISNLLKCRHRTTQPRPLKQPTS